MRFVTILSLALALPAGAQGASLKANVSQAEVGVPVTIELTAYEPLPQAAPGQSSLDLERLARTRLRERFGEVLFDEAALDYSWLLFEAEPLVIRRTTGVESRATLVASRRFSLVSLEPGQRTLPAPTFDGELEPIALQFDSVLAREEDAPRPLRSFRPLPSEAPKQLSSPWGKVAFGGLFAAIVVGILVRLKRRRKKGQKAQVIDAGTALASLLSEVRADVSGDQHSKANEVIRSAHFQATALLRAAFETKLGEPAETWLTDEEWLLAHEAQLGLSEKSRHDLERFFSDCALVKYGGVSATEWGLEERTEMALMLLEKGAQ